MNRPKARFEGGHCAAVSHRFSRSLSAVFVAGYPFMVPPPFGSPRHAQAVGFAGLPATLAQQQRD
jgi:hypothetical protein